MNQARDYGILLALLALVIAGQLLYPGFLERENLSNILAQNAALGLVAVGVTYVTICAGFDLSVPAVIGVGAVVAARFSELPFLIMILAVGLMGLLCGVINGIVVARMRVNPFIATLGTSLVFGGTTLLYTQGMAVSVTDASFIEFGQSEWLGIRVAAWIMIGAFITAGLVLSKTAYGRSLYAVGGNTEAARLAGLRTDAVRVSTYGFSGVTSALAGLILASTLQVGQADLGQGNYALLAITVIVIGGSSLFGGSGAMWRTAAGLALVALLTNLFNSLGINSAWQQIVQGVILIFTVAADVLSQRAKRSK